MTRVTYTGLIDPAREFEALRPAYNVTVRMMMKCRPSSADYLVLLAVTDAMNAAAAHFMPQPAVTSFFGAKPTG